MVTNPSRLLAGYELPGFFLHPIRKPLTYSRSATDMIKLLDLPEDLILATLCHCDVLTILRLEQVRQNHVH